MHPASSIRALARDLGRDVKRVHADVTAVERIGLIDRDGTALWADYSEIQTSILLEVPAAWFWRPNGENATHPCWSSVSFGRRRDGRASKV